MRELEGLFAFCAARPANLAVAGQVRGSRERMLGISEAIGVGPPFQGFVVWVCWETQRVALG
jgi:hypothetical protein